MSLLNQFLAYFGVRDELASTIMLCFICAFIIVEALRIVLYIGYQTQYGIFALYSKELRTKEDISGIKKGVFSKIVRDYVRSQNKGVSHVSTEAIVQKHFLRLRFIFWTYSSIHRFVSSMEAAYLFVGIILALFTNFSQLFGVFSIIVFIASKILSAIFDYELVKEKLSSEMIEYIEREVGAFYLSDFNSAINKLGTTLLEAVSNQSLVMSNSIKDLGTDLSGVLRLIVGDIRKNLDDSMNTIIEKADILNEPLSAWNEALENASKQQNLVNESYSEIYSAADSLKKMAVNLENILISHSNTFGQEKEIISEQIDRLSEMSKSLESSVSLGISSYDTINSTLAYIEKNQAVLEESLNKYEFALKNMTSGLSDGMSSIISYNIEKASQGLSDKLNDNISSISGVNNELVLKLQTLFDDLSQQTKAQTQAIINVKEQMDLHFDALNDKIL